MPDPEEALPGLVDPQASEELRDAYATLLERQAAPPPEPELPPRPAPRWLLAATVAWAALIGILLVPPGFARMPANRPFQPPADLSEPSARFGLWLAEAHIERFYTIMRRLPSTLYEAGVEDRAVTYDVNGEHSYRLGLTVGRSALVLGSGMNVDSFVGNSVATLQARADYQQAGVPGVVTAR